MNEAIKLFVCDDDKETVTTLHKRITKFFGSDIVCDVKMFYDGESLLKHCMKDCPDAVFLDIDMPNLNGFEVCSELQSIYENIFIVFVTSHEDKVYQSWSYNPFWFVRKTHLEDLNIVLPKLLSRITKEKSKSTSIVNLSVNNRIVQIDLDEVMYIEAFDHDINIVSKSGTVSTFRCKLSDAEVQLLPYDMIRIQKGVLVNLKFISRVTSREVTLTNNMIFSLGRDRVTDVKKRFSDYMRRL